MKPSREVLCFDIGSGGMSAARFNERLEAKGYDEIPWDATVSAVRFSLAFRQLLHSVGGNEPVAAISISSFMHSFLVMGPDGDFKTAVHTWMDGTASEGMAAVRNVVGSEFHQRTGCHYHPMFPVFKLASMRIGPDDRVVSPKTLLAEALTGKCVEDYGMASASGLLNIHSADWDADILRAANLTLQNLPRLMDRHDTTGKTASGVVVVNGSGDGFMANIGSGCESPNRIAITLGTSAAVRQMVSASVLNPAAGTFCYRATSPGIDTFLLGCASSNGGNVLDWARREFGVSTSVDVPERDIPIFLPWLNGERSLEWNSELRSRWYGRTNNHTPEELYRSVMEGVLFNLAQYVEVIEQNSGIRAKEIVLSGNGFLDPSVAPLLAALVSRLTLLPEASGLATLRGTALCAWRALGHDAALAVELLLERAQPVVPIADDRLHARYANFKQLRAAQ